MTTLNFRGSRRWPYSVRWFLLVLSLTAVFDVTGQPVTLDHDSGIQPLFDTVREPLRGPGYALHFVQLDDRGFFRSTDPNGRSLQLAAALHDIRMAGQANSIAVVFVHGWKHNAEKCDENVLCFNSLLTAIAEREKAGRHRQVVGVYLSWQGKTAQTSLFQQLTFWDRKKAVDTISSGGKVTYVLSAIADVARTAKAQLIIIGHSFGARLVFEGLSQPLIAEVMQANNHVWGETLNIVQTPVRGFGNLVILLNPAFEAAKYDTIALFAETSEGFPDTQRPRLLTISTNNDEATTAWFPLGMQLDLKWLVNPPPELTTTLGNYKKYQTDVLLPCTQATDDLAPPQPARSVSPPTCTCPVSTLDLTSSSSVPATLAIRNCYGGLSLRKLQSAANNPFIVARTDSRVIDGHGGIFSEALFKFLIEYIAASSE